MGRRTKLLNKDIYNNIIKLIKNGNYIKTACIANGITYSTYNNWEHWANDYSMDSSNGNEGKKIYFDFFEELKRAEAENIARNVENIQQASEKNNQWPASAWLLERKYPADFGKRMELEVGPSKVLLALQDRFASLKQGGFAEGALGEPQKQIEAKSRIDDDTTPGDRASK